MNRKKIIYPVIFLFILFLTNHPLVQVLSITNRKKQSERYFIKTSELNGFEISYTHSVNKGRVHDFYELNSHKGLILTSTRFVSYGAGIPEPIETEGAIFTLTDDGYVISNLNRHVQKLTMAVGLIANHELTINEKTYIMKDLFLPQTSIIFEIKRVSLLDYIIHSHL